MGIIIDAIVLVILALSVFIGYRKGLIKCAINVLSFFIAIIVVILLTTPISNIIINNTKLDDNIKSTILNSTNITNVDAQDVKLDENNSNSPKIVRDYMNDMLKDATGNVAETLAQNISIIIINVGVAIVLFVGTKVILSFVKILADIVGRIPLIKQFNKAGGCIYGIASGIIKIYLILAIISIIVPLLADASLVSAINQSIIAKGMYNNNLLLKIIL